ncbi:MAG: GTPase [Gloeobacteraceae cyanobacterium ES-bin-144]|nr:GTPase [Verrucomicrobiales bacterium]
MLSFPESQIFMNIPTTEHSPNSDSLLAICLFAAFSDGDKSESERAQITRICEELESENMAEISRKILMGKISIATAVGGLHSQQDRMLAYEMARGICEAGGAITPPELEFLTSLRAALKLSVEDAQAVDNEVDALSLAPVADSSVALTGVDNSSMILKYAILNGALELLPETFATMAIIPMQMKMVYRIGKAHGVEQDRSLIKEFLATAGVGLGSQVVEGFARKLIGGFSKKLGGKTVGKIANQVTGSAFSFASTYAIGHLAEKYHGGGKRLAGMEMKSLFNSMSEQARTLHAQYLPAIQERAKTLNPTSILAMVRGKDPV